MSRLSSYVIVADDMIDDVDIYAIGVRQAHMSNVDAQDPRGIAVPQLLCGRRGG